MNDREYDEKIEKLSKINEELFMMVIELNKYIRQMENMEKIRRLQKL